jgi:hypothetical protein
MLFIAAFLRWETQMRADPSYVRATHSAHNVPIPRMIVAWTGTPTPGLTGEAAAHANVPAD